MKKTINQSLFSFAVLAAALISQGAMANSSVETVRLISKSPISEQVPVSKVVCTDAQVKNQKTNGKNAKICNTVTGYESKTSGYHVEYEFGGKQYSANLVNNPGQTAQLKLTLVDEIVSTPSESYDREDERYGKENTSTGSQSDTLKTYLRNIRED